MPTLLIREGRNPYEVCTSVGIIAITLTAMIRRSSPSVSVQETLSQTQLILWSMLCLAGSVVTLVGLYWPKDHMTGLLIERAGQVMLTFSTAAYLVALCTVSTFDKSGLVMAIGCSIVAGAAWRSLKITKGVKRIMEARTAGGHRA